MTDFTAQLTDALREYSITCDEAIQEVLTDVAKQAQKRLTATSPSRTGKYKRSWKVKIERRQGFCKVHIHNTRYQLTHLLEFGHKAHSGHAEARPHIASVEKWAVAEAEKRIKEVLSG
jgi:hypothetical protein